MSDTSVTETAPGRPSKLTPHVEDRICLALRLGHFRAGAAKYAGISERTLTAWLHRGEEEGEGPYSEFARRVREAEEHSEILALGLIQKAAQEGEWRAAAWLLERRHPERYCSKAQIFLAQRLARQARPDTEGLTDAEMEAVVLRTLYDLAQQLPREKMIAAIDANEPPPVPTRRPPILDAMATVEDPSPPDGEDRADRAPEADPRARTG